MNLQQIHIVTLKEKKKKKVDSILILFYSVCELEKKNC